MDGSDKIPIGIAQNSKLQFHIENSISVNGTWWNPFFLLLVGWD
jgi:hypothetical protein